MVDKVLFALRDVVLIIFILRSAMVKAFNFYHIWCIIQTYVYLTQSCAVQAGKAAFTYYSQMNV